jgi:hypothetical protein
MRTNDSRYMQPVMSEIAHSDPETFRAMVADNGWYVTVIDRPQDLTVVAERVDPGAAYQLMRSLGSANAITVSPVESVPAKLRGQTWLNRPYIAEEAAETGVEAVKFAAMVLVHEWAHHLGELEEGPAYDAGIEFARKMGEPLIVANQHETKRQVAEREAAERKLIPFPGQQRIPPELRELIEEVLGGYR